VATKAFQFLQEDLELGQSALVLAPPPDLLEVDAVPRGDADGDVQSLAVVLEEEAGKPIAAGIGRREQEHSICGRARFGRLDSVVRTYSKRSGGELDVVPRVRMEVLIR
jgi:hypothetical protein